MRISKTITARLLIAAVALTSCLISAPATFGGQTAREQTSLDIGWKFSLEAPSQLANSSPIEKWQWVGVAENPKQDGGNVTFPADSTAWNTAALHEDTFKGRLGFSWYRTTLPELSGKGRVVRFSAVDDNADVYLNGNHLTHHDGYNTVFSAFLDDAWIENGPNVLMVLVENTAGGGGITGDVVIGNDLNAEAVQPTAPGFDDSGWRTVSVPHDYMIEQPFSPDQNESNAYLPTPSAWYRKTVMIPKADRNRDYWLDFEGIYRDAKIYVDGKFMIEHQSGYVPVHIDVSSLAKPGEPLSIAVHVDPSQLEGWWYEGAGIYRNVWLTSVDRLHIEPFGIWVVPKVSGEEAHPDVAVVDANATLKNTGSSSEKYNVVESIFDPSGNIAASVSDTAAMLDAGATTVAQTSLTLSHPLLWSLEAPNLYRLETKVLVDGRLVDQTTTDFGVRTVRFDPNEGFFLNGKSIKIEGFANHQDYAALGIGVPDNLEYWRVKKMLALGANAWRTAHNPPTASLLDACDKLGMLVLDENRHLGDAYTEQTYSASTTASDLSDLDALILRDRNHPSIIAWSLCNEEPLQGTAAGAALFKTMMDRIHQLDPTRLVTSAMNHSWGTGISLVEDMQGCNYLIESFAQFHKNFPDKPMLFTESSSAVQDRGMYTNDRVNNYLGDYTNPNEDWLNWVKRTEDAWRPIGENDYLSGTFVWAGFSYKGEPFPYHWPNISCHYGVLDTCGFPKDDSYFYKVYWGSKPALHIAPHWTWPASEGKPIQVVVFSNEPTVDLVLNGFSLGRKTCPMFGHAEWTVPYAPGTLTANGYDASGNLKATDQQTTAGSPYAIELRTDLPKMLANGEDVSVIEASIVDEKGNFAPTASVHVNFSVEGDAGMIAGTDNGDPNDHTLDSSPDRNAFNGELAAMIRSTGKRGIVKVTAAGPGLQPASITIKYE